MRIRAIAIIGASILIAAALLFYGYTNGNFGRTAATTPLPPAPQTQQASQPPAVQTPALPPPASPESPIGDAPEIPVQATLPAAPNAPQFPLPDAPAASENARLPGAPAKPQFPSSRTPGADKLPDAPKAEFASKLPNAPSQPLFPHAEASSTGAGLQLKAPLSHLKPKNILDTFNDSRGGGTRKHEATDILAPKGTPIYAVADGTVKKLFLSKPGGKTIYQFDRTGQYCYYYAHLDHYAEGLHEGQAVRPGDLIGYVGTTGDAAPDTPHLHFAIFKLGPEKNWWQGTPLNPYPYLHAAVR